ncbi:hypothetical protein AAY473_013103, partial [Plecturocebus cupreus]
MPGLLAGQPAGKGRVFGASGFPKQRSRGFSSPALLQAARADAYFLNLSLLYELGGSARRCASALPAGQRNPGGRGGSGAVFGAKLGARRSKHSVGGFRGWWRQQGHPADRTPRAIGSQALLDGDPIAGPAYGHWGPFLAEMPSSQTLSLFSRVGQRCSSPQTPTTPSGRWISSLLLITVPDCHIVQVLNCVPFVPEER